MTMNKMIIVPAFVLMVLAQLFVPAQMIFNKEKVITTGREFRFKTAPVDPNDPFRGKYISLYFDETSFRTTNAEGWMQGDPIFVSLTTDESGFAKIKTVTKDKPEDEDYINASIGYIMDDSVQVITIQYPFDRFYMEETKAYNAEQAYNESARDTAAITYALVKVRNGDAVITDVMIDGKSIKEIAETWDENQ